jgi:hypothetical protein
MINSPSPKPEVTTTEQARQHKHHRRHHRKEKPEEKTASVHKHRRKRKVKPEEKSATSSQHKHKRAHHTHTKAKATSSSEPVIAKQNDLIKEATTVTDALNAGSEKDNKLTLSLQEDTKSQIMTKAYELRKRLGPVEIKEGVGNDTYKLEGRLLKSAFLDDEGKPLPYAERHKIMQALDKKNKEILCKLPITQPVVRPWK